MEGRLLAGRYELLEPVGGSSWRATDSELGRDVVVRLGAAADVPGAALSHPNIERVFDQGEEDGERYAVVELLPGGALPDRGELTDEAAADVAAALAYAHAQGVAHGALTDRSIRFDADGRAKVTGFGGGDPAGDVRAFGGLLAAYGSAAVAPVAAAASAGELDAPGLVERLPTPTQAPAAEEEAATLIRRPATPPGRNRTAALVLVAAVLAAAGLVAALLAASDDSTAERPTSPLSVPVPTATDETEEPPSPTEPSTEETTTEETEPATTQETEPPTTATEPPVVPSEPLPTVVPTEPPLPTEPPPTTELPPTTSEIVPP